MGYVMEFCTYIYDRCIEPFFHFLMRLPPTHNYRAPPLFDLIHLFLIATTFRRIIGLPIPAAFLHTQYLKLNIAENMHCKKDNITFTLFHIFNIR